MERSQELALRRHASNGRSHPEGLTVEWTRGETVLGRTTLEIGTSRAWRTWATRRVTARDVDGGVRARILDGEGAVLTVLETPVATGAATPAA
jgi:hypothetical protein